MMESAWVIREFADSFTSHECAQRVFQADFAAMGNASCVAWFYVALWCGGSTFSLRPNMTGCGCTG